MEWIIGGLVLLGSLWLGLSLCHAAGRGEDAAEEIQEQDVLRMSR